MAACPTIPLSCLDPTNIFAGVMNYNCGGFADPSNFQAERAIFDSGFNELINNYGVTIGYYINGFNLSAMNPIYGEHTTQTYYGPVSIKSYVEMENPSPLYSLAGFDASDKITAYVHIKTFTALFSALSVYPANGQFVEPKAQDKIIIWPFGCDRPNGRGAKIFEVTDVTDEDAGSLNPLYGHYVYRIQAMRSEFNSETNEPRENVNYQAYDNTYAGKLSSSIFPSLTGEEKWYPNNADNIAQTQILPPTTENNGSVYGNYF
jgi:hypothetical protein